MVFCSGVSALAWVYTETTLEVKMQATVHQAVGKWLLLHVCDRSKAVLLHTYIWIGAALHSLRLRQLRATPQRHVMLLK